MAQLQGLDNRTIPSDLLRWPVKQYLDICVFPQLGCGTKRKQGVARPPFLGEGPAAMFVSGLIKRKGPGSLGAAEKGAHLELICFIIHVFVHHSTAEEWKLRLVTGSDSKLGFACLPAACGSLGKRGAGALLRGLLEKVLKWAAAQRPYIAPAAWERAVKDAAAAAEAQVPQKNDLIYMLKVLLDNIAHTMLILVDEAQFLMMPGKPGGGVNADEADWMRDVVVRQLIIYNASTQIFVFTRSTMALMWLALARMPTNGRSPLMAIMPLDLPSEFPESHMQASLVCMTNSEQACQALQEVGAAIGVTEEQLVVHSPNTPACLTILKQDWDMRGGKKWPSVQPFVQSWTVNKLQREIIVDWTRAMLLLTRAQCNVLRRLANPHEGLAVLEHLEPGLVWYLKPHCEKNKAGRFYLRAVETRTVLQVIIAEDSSLNTSWTEVAGDSSAVNLSIIRDLHAVGETVYRMAMKQPLPQAGVDELELCLEVGAALVNAAVSCLSSESSTADRAQSERMRALASDLDARLPCGQWKDEMWHQHLSPSAITSADAKAYKAAKAAAPEGAPLTAKEELKWVLRSIRHITAQADILKPETLLTDPGTGQDLEIKASEIGMVAIFPKMLQCSHSAFAQRLADARGCGVEQEEQQQQQLPGTATPYKAPPKANATKAKASSYAGLDSRLQPALCRGIPAPLLTSRQPGRLRATPMMAANIQAQRTQSRCLRL
ncbi:hypothetical protein WJX74_003665 [Apatococcus lobatus]|uniref:Uncharacterized protein n=1 Tax=Apatococcus lobatus TaxID=904363 RepID=A0AAW1RX86_9CHLO